MLVTAVLRDAGAAHLAPVIALLRESGLPTADIDVAELRDFIVALDGGAVVGVVGLERHGEDGLLRSLAVAPGWRGHGLGHALVEAIEARAAKLGVRLLALLTQTAAAYFAARGYAPIPRAHAPAAVQSSAEFSTLCPASSTCMVKALTTCHT
jgi:amino-acid N-acetyltransferase